MKFNSIDGAFIFPFSVLFIQNRMEKITCRVIMFAFFIIIYVIPTIALSIASFIIAADNWDTTCDEDAIVSLHTWLIVTGTIGTGISLLCMFFNTLYLLLLIFKIKLIFYSTIIIILPYCAILLLSSIFLIAWNIIGAVALFRDSYECKETAHSIFVMVAIVLAFQWFSMLYHFCMPANIIKKNKDDNDV